MGSTIHKTHHHVLPTGTALTIGGVLLFLTAVTVWIAKVDLGHLNFVIAMAVATSKALLVALFFMNLKYDRRENGMIFVTSFLFLAIFLVLTSTDLFFRGDVSVKGPFFVEAQTRSKISKPWISTPELIAHGKELFVAQCVSCHGPSGKGDGPAASALNPRPRDFTSVEGWKNGRRPTMVFKTLKEGLPPSAMASYATLPADDRWALSHYVLSLGPKPEADTSADFAKVGINPNQEGGGETVAATIPVELAMSQLTVPETPSEREAHLFSAPPTFERVESDKLSPGARLYTRHCLECHGPKGEGGLKVKTLGVYPTAYVITEPLTATRESLKSLESFKSIVSRGVPGDLMPGFGNLSGAEIQELYQFIHSFQVTGNR